MTAEQLYQYLQHPEQLDRDTILSLRELTEQYPAFETGWILYLRNLKNIESPYFEKELINGAPRIHDRRALYIFLNERSKPDEVIGRTSDPEESEDIYSLLFPSAYHVEQGIQQFVAPEETPLPVREEADKKNLLIEKFLETQPSMPPVRENEPAAPVESQKAALPDEEDFFTETLALIYARQGYHKKAIHIFEKLSLKYPEKSAYFAGQIEKIKSLTNN